MAEGWAKHLYDGRMNVFSAGTRPTEVDPNAIAVMKEVGIDISHQYSKNVSTLLNVHFDLVITVCDDTREQCPVFPGKMRKMHFSFDDPPEVTKNMTDSEKKFAVYRRVRDEIGCMVRELEKSLIDTPRD